MKQFVPALVLFFSVNFLASAHEVRPALLKVSEVSEGRYLIHWKVPAMGNQRLAIDPVFDAGCDAADDRVDGFAAGAAVRSWYVSCSGGIADTEIGFSNLPSTMIDVLVQVTFLDGRYYTDLVRPSAPVYHVPARDGQASVFGSYLTLGVEHILFGWDHLLFVLGLVLLVTNYRRLFWAVTGFTVAHSVTLALATLNIIRVPGPPVEAVIALSIVLLAVEASRYRRTETETLAIRSPWLVSMGIGLVHGLGFAGALSEFGLPAHARFISLLAFNLGVEIGQVLFIASLIALGAVARRIEMPLLPQVRVAATWLIGVCGSFWLTERVVGFF
ncbi:MAG: HupE/UreJ family protein [Candidatus Hydrogenedentota bacterium]